MGAAFFKEAGHEGNTGSFNPSSFGATLDALAPHGLLLVVEEKGEVVGMGAADVSRAFWNHDVVVGREAFWYIKKAHRKGQGRELLKRLEEAAKRCGATIFDVVAEDGEGKRGDALARLYRAGGYSPAEKTFRKRL
jgi:GNAT superfamily N-acetyltransferase